MTSTEIMLIRASGDVEIFTPSSWKISDMKDLGEGFLDVSDLHETNLTIIKNSETIEHDLKINSVATAILNSIGAFQTKYITGYQGDVILSGPFNSDDDTLSPIPEEWMLKINEKFPM